MTKETLDSTFVGGFIATLGVVALAIIASAQGGDTERPCVVGQVAVFTAPEVDMKGLGPPTRWRWIRGGEVIAETGTPFAILPPGAPVQVSIRDNTAYPPSPRDPDGHDGNWTPLSDPSVATFGLIEAGELITASHFRDKYLPAFQQTLRGCE